MKKEHDGEAAPSSAELGAIASLALVVIERPSFYPTQAELDGLVSAYGPMAAFHLGHRLGELARLRDKG